MKNKICLLLLLFISSYSFAQHHNFDYQREIMGINEAWHKLELPNEIFGKISPKLNDIRIIGITAQNDSIEAPYILHSTEDLIKNTAIDFKLLNQSRDKNGYYFTFKLPTANTINQIQLNFEQENFDWNIRLEGSQNQQNWYTLIEDYRILSIKNAHTNYQFSKLNFPDANYSFYRVLINSKEKPKLKNAALSLQEIVTGKSRKYARNKTNTFENKKLQQSELDIDMGSPVLINNIKITVNENFDYYRPIHIQYVTDSTKTETGWIYNYQTLTSGTLSSIEKNEFQFNNTIAQHVKIFIHNSDSEALTINRIEVEGSIYELLIRFSKPAKYFLCYGNRNAHKPNYDIARFTENVPKSISTIHLGNEIKVQKKESQKKEPLFANEKWLWALMAIIILILGGFTLKMIKKTDER
ncbi:hypothetical protein BZG02_06415 [Labilibaculum filiforme]|uniref:DUF3999 domain-containing protein n=1 Tax=Labilibaculum filiforme TaxID=1940526 RepID=A0A2N3I294_9BACT|nr:DUF3999 family protein [Labilibaculum filiforme]PKQ64438.1 hypothetical protein BZG02_06415 [Labilibaculum filiforme]